MGEKELVTGFVKLINTGIWAVIILAFFLSLFQLFF